MLADTSCGDVWKLQLVELLLQDWLLQPHQAVQLLNVFDKWVYWVVGGNVFSGWFDIGP